MFGGIKTLFFNRLQNEPNEYYMPDGSFSLDKRMNSALIRNQ